MEQNHIATDVIVSVVEDIGDQLAAAGVDSHRSFANVRDPRNKETGYAQQDAKGGAESGGLQHPLTAGPESPWAAW